MGKPCDCSLSAARINDILAVISIWPDEGHDTDMFAIAQMVIPPARVRDVNMVFDHLAKGHDMPNKDPQS